MREIDSRREYGFEIRLEWDGVSPFLAVENTESGALSVSRVHPQEALRAFRMPGAFFAHLPTVREFLDCQREPLSFEEIYERIWEDARANGWKDSEN